MRIKDMPWWNRPGNRLKREGVNSLTDAELLAIILERGNSKENAIDLANRVLAKYNLHKLANLSIEELTKLFGDEVKAFKIQAMFEIYKKTGRLEKNGFKSIIESAKDVYNYFVDELKDKKREYFYALLLDSRNGVIKVIRKELISVGTLNGSLVHPREVFKEAIKASANAIILVHNHPSGDCTPSEEDKQITSRMKEIGEYMGIKVVDHIIIAENKWISVN